MRPLTILFLAANPSDTVRLRTDDERRLIDVEIIKSGQSHAIELVYEPAVRPGALIEALRRHRPSIVHFAGHGSASEEIVLESNDGRSRLVTIESLGELFRLHGESVKLVVLNACYTDRQAETITRSVPCAIGMRRAIPDATAVAFASAFYQGVAFGESVRDAFDSGLLQVLDFFDASRADPGTRDLGPASPARAEAVPELKVKSGVDPAALRLVSGAEVADREGPDGRMAGAMRRARPAPSFRRRSARRSRGLAIDRDRGALIGMTLTSLGLVALLSKLAASFDLSARLLPSLPPWLWPAGAVSLGAGVVLLGPWPYRRSQLLSPERLWLHKDNPDHFRGRDDDIDRVLDCCRSYPLTCLVGESGSGKSTLVHLGLPSGWPAGALVTIDQWGLDWDQGPRDALTAIYRRLRHAVGMILVIFDQVDDYQVRHRDKFLENLGLWKDADAIADRSPYWMALRQLVGEGRVHVLLVARSDASPGLSSLEFAARRVYQLGRLRSEFVRPLLAELIVSGDGGEVIADPQFGWQELEARLVQDLQSKGLVLPVQLSVALRSLGFLPSLTVGAYEKAGGLPGLETLMIERQVAEVALALELDEGRVLELLLALVDRENELHKPRPMRAEELCASLPRGPGALDAADVQQALEMLEDREVVRRSASTGPGDVSWVLDHDYLCRGVIGAEQRAYRWQTELRDAYRAWDKAGGSFVRRWWTGLLEPRTQVVLLYQRLRRRLRYGEAAGYALRSTLRFTPYLAALAVVVATVEGYRFLRASALVDVISSTADQALLTRSIEELDGYRGWADPLLRRVLDRTRDEPGSLRRLHASLALLPVDPGQAKFLGERLLDAEPSGLPTILDALSRTRTGMLGQLWDVIGDPNADPAARLRAACALAAYEPPEAGRAVLWKAAAPDVTAGLIDSIMKHPDHYTPLLAMLRAARDPLIDSLQDAFRDPDRHAPERLLAANILADFAGDRPRLLADLLMDADPDQFDVLFSKIRAREDESRVVLEAEIGKSGSPPGATDAKKEALAQRKARAAVALLRLSRPEKVWPLLRHSSDPRVRGYLVNWLRPLKADPMSLGAELVRLGRPASGPPAAAERPSRMEDILFHPVASIRRALILALGEFEAGEFPPGGRDTLAGRLLEIYRSDPDAGTHVAAEWALRRWGREPELEAEDARLILAGDRGNRRWYVTRQRHTFALVEWPVEFWMGSPPDEAGRFDSEVLHRQRIGRGFAVSTKEVTVEQFQEFLRASPRVRHKQEEPSSPERRRPQNGVSWFEAAAYCNWLSREEGLDECYKPNRMGDYASGMTIVGGALRRPGYRLPTAAEWEYACRAGAATSRYYGGAGGLLTQYGWYVANSCDRVRPCGLLKPNDLGLLDMMGNVYEWCRDRESPDAPAAERGHPAEGDEVVALDPRIIRGGSYAAPASLSRSAARDGDQPSYQSPSRGFRPVRTLP